MNNLQPNSRKAAAQNRRHLAVYFPWLPAERLIRTRAAPPDTPFAIVEKQKGATRLVAVSQAVQRPQSLTATLADVTVSIVQGTVHFQSLTATLEGVTVAAAQSLQRPQSLAVTLEDVSVAIAQSTGHLQSLAVTLGSVDVAVSQTSIKSQALAITLDDATFLAAQVATRDQTLAVVLDGVAFAAVQVASAAPTGGHGRRKFAAQIGGRLELFENEEERARWLADQEAPTAAKTSVVVPKLVAVHTVPNGLGKRLEAARGIVARMPAPYVPPIDLRSIDVNADLRRWLDETDDEEALLMLMA